MKRILLMASLFLSLMVCFTSPAWTGSLDDLNAGLVAFDGRNYDEAIRLFTKAIASEELSKKDLSIAYYGRGFAWDQKGDYDKAIADYTKVVEIVPKDAELYYLRGLAWRKKRDYDRAIADFTKVIELAPRYADAYGERGFTWGKKGDYDRAIADYTKVIEIDPKDSVAYHERGRAWEAKGNYDKAKADYAKANELIDNHQ